MSQMLLTNLTAAIRVHNSVAIAKNELNFQQMKNGFIFA